jgi:hypothetical protein
MEVSSTQFFVLIQDKLKQCLGAMQLQGALSHFCATPGPS